MDKDTFQRHLYQATEDVLNQTRTLISDALPSDHLYLVSHREGFNPHVADGEAFPDPAIWIAQGDLPDALRLLNPPTDALGVVDNLWRNDKVPHWINIIVHGTDEHHTYFLLRCSGCFTALEDVAANGRPLPLLTMTPSPPHGWKIKDARGIPDLEESLKVYGRYPIRNFDILGR